MFKVDNKDTISIVDFKQVDSGWVTKLKCI